MNIGLSNQLQNRVNVSIKDTIKLKDIEQETWSSEIAKNSLITLIDEHEPDSNIIGSFLLTLVIMTPIIALKIFNESFKEYLTIFYILVGISSVIASLLLAQGIYKILKLKTIKTGVYAKINGSLLHRKLQSKDKVLIGCSVIFFFSLIFFIQVLPLISTVSLLLLSYSLFAFLLKAVKDAQHYHYVLSNAAFLLGHIQLDLKTQK